MDLTNDGPVMAGTQDEESWKTDGDDDDGDDKVGRPLTGMVCVCVENNWENMPFPP